MKTREEILDYCLTFPDVYQDAPFHDENWQLIRCRKNKKAFAWTYEREGRIWVNVKVDPEWREFWRQAYHSVVPGWHQNKEHWNTIILDGSVPADDIKRMIAESYDLIVGKKYEKDRTEFYIKGKRMMNRENIAKTYIDGLKEAYIKSGAKEQWDEFEKIVYGASDKDIAALKEIYPEVPESLIELLKIVDGTYWRKYKEEEIAFYFLGSDLSEYPYYLLSAGQMVESRDEAYKYYADYVNREYDAEDIPVDEKIISDAKKMRWLHFSDCMNNGGTSQLFIDFSPSDKGKSGQIVRFLHDPDEIEVIAESFDEYLMQLMQEGYDFINEDTID